VLFFIQAQAKAVDAECSELFETHKIIPNTDSCLMKCLTVKIDMKTFICHDQCEAYCKGPCENILSEIRKKIKNNSPAKWPLKEKFFQWSTTEKQNVTTAVTKIPGILVNTEKFEIYRMDKSENFPNPGTSGDSDPRTIVLYTTAFNGKYNLERVLAHEFAHIYYQKMSANLKESYNLKMNWFLADPKKERWISRKDGFVEEDGRISPEEDFANNLEYYLFDLQKLKTVTSNAFDWIQSNIGDLKMKPGCKYEK